MLPKAERISCLEYPPRLRTGSMPLSVSLESSSFALSVCSLSSCCPLPPGESSVLSPFMPCSFRYRDGRAADSLAKLPFRLVPRGVRMSVGEGKTVSVRLCLGGRQLHKKQTYHNSRQR